MGSRELRRFSDTAMGRATGTSRHAGNHDGDDWAERHLEATNYGLPAVQDQRRRARTTDSDISGEYKGGNHKIVMHEQDQSGDPLKPHGVPPGYEHPQRLGRDVLDPGGPRIWPVSQAIEHGPQKSRRAEWNEAIQEAAPPGAFHTGTTFFDRRSEGRRHRSGCGEPQEPPTRGGWQRDVNTLTD